MLQQTTVQAVLPYYERWLREYPDVAALARAPLRKVLRSWQGLGYYQRARNIREAARTLVRDHGGRLPDDPVALRRLPGFGPYTAAAVLSLAFQKPAPVIDANVRRVLMRVLGHEGQADARLDRTFGTFLEGRMPKAAPGDFNQAMMELGALVCRSRNPQCLACPVRGWCRAARDGKQEVIPRGSRVGVERIDVAVAVIIRDGRMLIQKRPAGGLLAGLWEFPGGKVEAGESRLAALRRELREELGVEVEGIRRLTTVRHDYTRFQATLHVFTCRLRDCRLPSGPGRRWVTLKEIAKYPLPSGSVKIVDHLAARRRPRAVSRPKSRPRP